MEYENRFGNDGVPSNGDGTDTRTRLWWIWHAVVKRCVPD